jgi:sulfatase modifying factor 1
MKALSFALLFCTTLMAPSLAATLCSDLLAGSARIDGTDGLMAYIATLLDQKILSNEEFSQFIDNLEKGNIVNPIADIKTRTSSASLMQHGGIDKLINETQLDRSQLLEWAKETQEERGGIRIRREETRIVTEDIYHKMEFVLIPAGSFKTREDHKTYTVTLTHPFNLMTTPVTQKQWVDEMGENPSKFVNGDDTTTEMINSRAIKMQPDNPVESITWWSAIEFANRMSIKAGLKPAYDLSKLRVRQKTRAEDGSLATDIDIDIKLNAPDGNIYLAEGYRLPTHAEANYLRHLAGKINPLYNESSAAELDEHAWYVENSDKKTHPVAQLKPLLLNGVALYDVLGNVWEWSHNCEGSVKAGSDPQDAPKGTPWYSSPEVFHFKRVAHGGGFNSDRGSYYYVGAPGALGPAIGLRIVRTQL